MSGDGEGTAAEGESAMQSSSWDNVGREELHDYKLDSRQQAHSQPGDLRVQVVQELVNIPMLRIASIGLVPRSIFCVREGQL